MAESGVNGKSRKRSKFVTLRVLVMGSGAIGGCYGALLGLSGNDVTLVARGDICGRCVNRVSKSN